MPTHDVVITNQSPPYTNPPFFAYLMRAELELSKFDENEKHCVAWFNKAKEYFDIYNI